MTLPIPSRLARIPGYLWNSGKGMLPAMVILAILSGFRAGDYAIEYLRSGAPPIVLTLLVTWLGGAALGPALLSWLPGESLFVKGLMAGILALTAWPAACMPLHLTPLDVTMAVLIIPALSALLTLRFAPQEDQEPCRRWSPVLVAPVALAAGIWIMARFI